MLRSYRLVAPLLLVASVAVGCHDSLAPATLPSGSVPMIAPETYARWWAETEACSGRKGTIKRVNWYMVPNSDFFWYGGETYDGYWFRYHHQIILASASIPDSNVVRHEMLHDLLDDGNHPAEFFQKRCGGVVAQKLGRSSGEIQ